MKSFPWRDVLVGLAIAVGTMAVGSAVEMRDRVAAAEIREAGREDTRSVRDADILRRLERIETKLDRINP